MRDQSPLLNPKIADFLASVLHCGLSGHLKLIGTEKNQFGRLTLHEGKITQIHFTPEKDGLLPEEALIEALSWPSTPYEWTEKDTDPTSHYTFNILDLTRETNAIQEALACVNFESTRCKQFVDMRTALLPYSLTAEHSSGQTFEYDIEHTPTRFGRSLEAQISLNDHGISRIHAELTLSSNGMWISDLGSSNGTFINGYKIESYDLFPYSFKDVFSIGSFTFRPTTTTCLRASILKYLSKREISLLTRKKQTISGIELQPIIDKYIKSKHPETATNTQTTSSTK